MTTTDRYRFALSPDGAQLAVWAPGQEPWVVHPLPSPREGGWVTTSEMDRQGWQLFVPVPADRDALRQRIADALRYWVHPTDRGEAADAVLDVLPELTGQTTDRAAARAEGLREAADFYERVLNQSLDPASDPRYCTAVRDIVMGLRRRADETQPTTEPEPGCTHCGKTIRRITGTLTEWWVHIPGGRALCYPWQPAKSPSATPKPAAEVQQDDTWPVKEDTRRYAAELRGTPGTVVADGHTGWECDAGASLIVEASTPGPGKLGTHHGVIYACAGHRAAAEERITGAGYEVDPRSAPPGHRWNPWPCGHVTAHDSAALAALAVVDGPTAGARQDGAQQ